MDNQQEFRFDSSECDFCSSRSEKTENYSAERPPQHKKANESSQQVAAGTTAAAAQLLVNELAAAVQTQLHMYEPGYTTDHVPPSNNSTSTDATAVANITTSNSTFTTPAYIFFSDKGLTESVLAHHQYQLQQMCPGDMGDWLEGAGPGCTRLAVAQHYKKGRRRGRHVPRSKPSQASDASYEFVALPSTVDGQNMDILAAGALFDETTNPYMHSSLHFDM